tara:strand:- start:640 stop:852 length:213 start_codon:yes stop_codon:yes gene_type:complete
MSKNFLGDDHKKPYQPDFDDSGIKSPGHAAKEQEIEEMVHTNNFFTYDDTIANYDPTTFPFSYFYTDICG